LGNLPTLPYEDSFFDMIHASHVVEHLMPETLYEFLKECDRCLKVGGFLVISAPLLSDIFYDDLSHIKPYQPAVFKKYLARKNAPNYTRPPISQKYEVREEVYRFIEVPFDEYRFFIKSRLINALYHRWQRFCYKIGFRRYVKNGFTLILQKT
jgi:SAM-dependent methyltransferase